MNGVLLALVVGSLMPGPAGNVEIIASGCTPEQPYVSCTGPGTQTIYFAPPYQRDVLLHELGHQFDYDNMDADGRAEFEAINGDPRPWRSAPNSPHEQFAVAYQMCATYKRWPRRWEDKQMAYGLKLGPKRFAKACQIISRRAL